MTKKYVVTDHRLAPIAILVEPDGKSYKSLRNALRDHYDCDYVCVDNFRYENMMRQKIYKLSVTLSYEGKVDRKRTIKIHKVKEWI